MITYELKRNIRNASEFRANPDNYYHNCYQRAVNRVFMMFITSLSCVAYILTHTPRESLTAFILCVAGALVLAITLLILVEFFKGVGALIDWAFSGF